MVRSEGGDPVAVASEAARHAERGDRPFEGRRVLVVEDEDIVALDLEDTLRALGCEVLGPAASVARALALLARERPDAVTLGLDLLDGLAVPAGEPLASTGVPFLAGHRQVKLEEDGEARKLARAANLCGGFGASDLGPHREGLRADGAVVSGRKMIAVEVEEVVELVVGGEEPLRLAG